MSRMKTFFKYFLAIVICYVVVNVASFFVLKSTYNTKDYSVEDSILDVQVEEAKATFVNGYINGKIKNNTQTDIDNKYLKVDSYSKRGVHLGSKYTKIKDLIPGEETDFESSFNYEQIDNMKLSIIDGAEIAQGTFDFNFDNTNADTMMTIMAKKYKDADTIPEFSPKKYPANSAMIGNLALHGIKLFPLNPIFRKIRSNNNAILDIYPVVSNNEIHKNRMIISYSPP